MLPLPRYMSGERAVMHWHSVKFSVLSLYFECGSGGRESIYCVYGAGTVCCMSYVVWCRKEKKVVVLDSVF